MRTTLQIDDHALQAAKEQVVDGIPIWMHAPGAVEVTTEMVRNLAEDE